MLYEKFLSAIDLSAEEICDISDKIWDFPETSFCEERASTLLKEALKKHGFNVTSGIADMPTAFTATFGEGGKFCVQILEHQLVDLLGVQIVHSAAVTKLGTHLTDNMIMLRTKLSNTADLITKEMIPVR